MQETTVGSGIYVLTSANTTLIKNTVIENIGVLLPVGFALLSISLGLSMIGKVALRFW